jgi:hypothetical protein
MARSRMQSVICAAVLMAVCSSAQAQTNRDGVVTLNGGRKTILVKPQQALVVPAAPAPSNLITIYSNLSTSDHVYNAIAGSGILGPDAGQPWPQWAASAFTPTADHTMKEVEVGVTYVSGANEVVVTLNADAGGVPGQIMHGWRFTNLPVFGTCCTLQTGFAEGGIPLKKNTKYWLTLWTSPQTPDTYAVWNDNYNGWQGSWANDLGSGWLNEGIQTLGAFAILGQ